MPGADDAENNAEVAFPARPSSRRSTQDEQIDLDYDEESNHGGSIEATNSVDEKPEEGPEEKEEGELEDGELSSSDEEPEKATVAVKQPISNVSPPRGKEKITVPSTAKPNETAWERGLREAREAMRRANKVREEPDFETKRLVAAPPLRRSSRNNTDSDHSPSPGPRRRNHSRSDSPRGGIPSLLDIRTSPPPRRLPPKDLGPQVIYPNGRPCPRRDGQDNRQRDNKRREPSPTRHRDRQDRGRSKGSQELKKTQKRLTMISTSPISSDSDDSDRKGPQRGNNGDSVSDPWARRKTTAKRRCRRSSSSSSNSDSSRSTIPGSRKKKSRSTSRSSSDSESDSDSDYEKKKKKKITKERSPPRGDISTYRIPKKSARKEEDAVEAFFSKKKSDLPAAFRKRRRDSDAGSGKKVKMEEISGSESDDSERSKSRTPPPPPPLSSSSTTTAAKNKKKAKSPSPISEDSDEETQPLPAPSSQQLDDVSPRLQPRHLLRQQLHVVLLLQIPRISRRSSAAASRNFSPSCARSTTSWLSAEVFSARNMSKLEEHSGVVPLDKSHKHKRNSRRQKKTNFVRGKLSAEDKKSIKYAQIEPIYHMWCGYFTDLVGEDGPLDDRMLKADYHGALFMVAEANNPTMVGLTGIVLMETRHTFQMVTKEDKYLVIPKQGSVFQFVLASRVFTVFGDAMRYKPHLRGKKQRLRGALPLFLR